MPGRAQLPPPPPRRRCAVRGGALRCPRLLPGLTLRLLEHCTCSVLMGCSTRNIGTQAHAHCSVPLLPPTPPPTGPSTAGRPADVKISLASAYLWTACRQRPHAWRSPIQCWQHHQEASKECCHSGCLRSARVGTSAANLGISPLRGTSRMHQTELLPASRANFMQLNAPVYSRVSSATVPLGQLCRERCACPAAAHVHAQSPQLISGPWVPPLVFRVTNWTRYRVQGAPPGA